MSLVVTGRLRALTMPEVTVELSPSGEPNATTWSPTRSTCAGAQAGRRQRRAALHVEHGQVVRRAAADHLRGVLVAVLVDDLDRPVVVDGVGDDVVVGDVVARPVEHEARPGGAVLLALVLRQHLDRARQQPLGDGGDRAVAGRQRRLRHGAGVGEAAAHPTLGASWCGGSRRPRRRRRRRSRRSPAPAPTTTGHSQPEYPAARRRGRAVLDRVRLGARRAGTSDVRSAARRCVRGTYGAAPGGGPLVRRQRARAAAASWCGGVCSRRGRADGIVAESAHGSGRRRRRWGCSSLTRS